MSITDVVEVEGVVANIFNITYLIAIREMLYDNNIKGDSH